MKRPTQHDVAKIANVSRGTVSLVVNDRTDGRVPISEDTRQRVIAAIAELGYEPDASARALRSGDTKAIGLVIHDIHNPHFWDNVAGVMQEAREAGYHLFLSSLGIKNEYGDMIFKDLLSQRIDGLILMGSFIDRSEVAIKTLAQLRKRSLSIVELNDHVSLHHHVDCVAADYRQATSAIIAYLLSCRHRRFALIYGVSIPQLADDRLQPYLDDLTAAGLLEEQRKVIYCGSTIEDGYQAAREVLQAPGRPTAIIAINDLLAIGVVRAAVDLGLRIPEDLSVVGYDDIFPDNYLVPRLTSVTKDADKMGREAVKLCLERIRDPDRPRQTVQYAARLIIRESTGQAPDGLD